MAAKLSTRLLRIGLAYPAYTNFTYLRRTALKNSLFLTLRILTLLAFLLMTLPAPAQAVASPESAAVKIKCNCWYQIEKGDTLRKIARIFGISVRELADANHITTSTKLKVGQILCIPRIAFTKIYPKASFTGSVALKRLYINGSNFPAKEKYFVRIRLRNQTTWTMLGMLTTDKNGKFETNFRIPNRFQEATRFEVCLKHTLKGYTVCNYVARVW